MQRVQGQGHAAECRTMVCMVCIPYGMYPLSYAFEMYSPCVPHVFPDTMVYRPIWLRIPL